MLNERLKTIRKQHCMTQEEIAIALGVDRTTYTFYETGKTKPSYVALVKLANIFNVSVDYLLGREFEVPENSYVDDASRLHGEDVISYLVRDERNLLMCYRVLTKEGKNRALETLRKLAAEYGNSVENLDD